MFFFMTLLLASIWGPSAAETTSKDLQLQDLPLAVGLYTVGDSKVSELPIRATF
jgi:hypothetical protein